MAKQPTNETHSEDTPQHPSTVSTSRPNIFAGRGWLYGVLAVVAVLLIFTAGMAVSSHHRSDVFRPGNTVKGPGAPGGFSRRVFGARDFGGGSTKVNGQTRTEGVVTSVNGNGFTLAGNGATTNVMTSSSTQYEGGNQVKQNDSVLVWGTESNGTIQATQILINP